MLRLTLLALTVNVLAKPFSDMHEFCDGKEPGLFSQGCSSNVTVCNKFGKELLLLCPFGLIFDETVEECRDMKMVEECRDMLESLESIEQSLDDLPRHLCEGLPDGFPDAKDCSTSVVQCSDGIPSLLECADGQVFDNTRHICASADEVMACRESNDVPDSSKDCDGLDDGLYEMEPCSSSYLTCSGGVPRIMSCPANLVFDKKLSLCEYPGNVESCSEQHEVNTTDVCPEDGFFSYGNCSDLFYACTNGRKISMYCPARLAFDESRQLCDYPAAVEVCATEGSGDGDEDGSSEGYHVDPMIKESWDSTTVDSHESSSKLPEPTFCESKKDGFYASGCSSEMIACVAGQATSMICPAHLIYDEEKQICEYPENVPCYVAAMNSEEEDETCSTDEPSADGPCSETFKSCVDGKVFHFSCDEGYAFSSSHGSCVESSKLEECSLATTSELEW